MRTDSAYTRHMLTAVSDSLGFLAPEGRPYLDVLLRDEPGMHPALTTWTRGYLVKVLRRGPIEERHEAYALSHRAGGNRKEAVRQQSEAVYAGEIEAARDAALWMAALPALLQQADATAPAAERQS